MASIGTCAKTKTEAALTVGNPFCDDFAVTKRNHFVGRSQFGGGLIEGVRPYSGIPVDFRSSFTAGEETDDEKPQAAKTNEAVTAHAANVARRLILVCLISFDFDCRKSIRRSVPRECFVPKRVVTFV